jgi:hypothetical protein
VLSLIGNIETHEILIVLIAAVLVFGEAIERAMVVAMDELLELLRRLGF